MKQEPESSGHDRQRSEFIRNLVQQRVDGNRASDLSDRPIPRTIVQFWHDLRKLPHDVAECVASWTRWEASGITHLLFDEQSARRFIGKALGERYELAFGRCYHPAMQSDYFRLCYLLVEGGFYVDADDVCLSNDIEWLFEDGRLSVQPLCYDIASGQMVESSLFLAAGAYDPNWIFYFNNNPLLGNARHPVVDYALNQATSVLELTGEESLPEIQETTGPGNLSKSIFDLGAKPGRSSEDDLLVLRDWDSFVVSRWPLSYRVDARNWRLSNQKCFPEEDG